MDGRLTRGVWKATTLALGCITLLATAADTAPINGAKDLFYKQLEKPQLAMNTGLQYWIELHRKGQVTKVSNKMAFLSGDKIRFHIRPNIDGYAYVLLKCGSKGNRDVLFPVAKFRDDNRIVSGKEVAIPSQANDFLEFDNDPGMETVGIVLSRQPIDAQRYLNRTQPVVIASGLSGSKDLVPSRIMVQPATVPDEDNGNSSPTTIASNPTTPTYVTDPAPANTTTSTTTTVSSSSSNSSGSSSSQQSSAAGPTVIPPAHSDESGVTTVVHQDGGTLGIDVVLQHL